MSSIITSKPGFVNVYQSKNSAVPGLIKIDPTINSGEDSIKSVLITSIGYNQAVNIQFMPSLQKLVYVYAFGDRMGDLTISGIAFDRVCNDESSSANKGVNTLMDYYGENRAIKESKIVKVNIGETLIRGFLVSMNISTMDLEFKLSGFTMNLAVLPEN